MRGKKLTQKETLAMYRNTCYAGMGIVNGETLPTDFECVQWLTRVRLHAERLQVGPHLPSVGTLPPWREWIKTPLSLAVYVDRSRRP